MEAAVRAIVLWGHGGHRSNVTAMDVRVTEAALELARKKGGNIALDFIRPVG